MEGVYLQSGLLRGLLRKENYLSSEAGSQPGQQNQSVSICLLSVSVYTFKRMKEIYKHINNYKFEFIISLPFSHPPPNFLNLLE